MKKIIFSIGIFMGLSLIVSAQESKTKSAESEKIEKAKMEKARIVQKEEEARKREMAETEKNLIKEESSEKISSDVNPEGVKPITGQMKKQQATAPKTDSQVVSLEAKPAEAQAAVPEKSVKSKKSVKNKKSSKKK